MKLRDYLIQAGGPGSGCHGPNCGRPHGSQEVSFKKGVAPTYGLTMNGIRFEEDPLPDFDRGVNSKLKEPPVPEVPKGQHVAAGLLMIEPDGKVWIVDPKGQYGGYKSTFSKGTIDEGESLQQTAIREAFEETGLLGKVESYLGDFQRSTSVTRYYIGRRIGGAPWDAGDETEKVRLVPLDKDVLYKRLLTKDGHETADHDVVDALLERLRNETE